MLLTDNYFKGVIMILKKSRIFDLFCICSLSLLQFVDLNAFSKKCKGEVKVKKENPCAIEKKGGKLGETNEEKEVFKNLTNVINKHYSQYQATDNCPNIDTSCVSGVLTAVHEVRVRNVEIFNAILGTEHPLKSAAKWLADYAGNLQSFKKGFEKLRQDFENAIKAYKECVSKADKEKAKNAKKAAGQEKKGSDKIVKHYNKLVEMAGHCVTMNEQLLHHMDLNNLDALVNIVNAAFIVLQEACFAVVSTNIYGKEITDQYSKVLNMATKLPQSFKETFKINVGKLIKQNNDNYNKLIEYVNKQIQKQGLTMIKEIENAFEANQIEQQQQEAINNYDKSVLEVGKLETDKDKMPNKIKTPDNSILNDDDEDSEDGPEEE